MELKSIELKENFQNILRNSEITIQQQQVKELLSSQVKYSAFKIYNIFKKKKEKINRKEFIKTKGSK